MKMQMASLWNFKYVRDNDFIQFISHPKLITDNNLRLIEDLILKTNLNTYNTDFKNGVLLN
jgi:hypothetical protein